MTGLALHAPKSERMIIAPVANGAQFWAGICRDVCSRDWVTVQGAIERRFRDTRRDVRFDAVGRSRPRSSGVAPSKRNVPGSHSGCQRTSVRNDVGLGILPPKGTLSHLRKPHGLPKRRAQGVSLCKREGGRFPDSRFLGSGAIASRVSERDGAKGFVSDGVLIHKKMAQAGYDINLVKIAQGADTSSFIELYIVQGSILEGTFLQVIIGDAITHIRQIGLTQADASTDPGALLLDILSDPTAETAACVFPLAEALERSAVTGFGTCPVCPNASATLSANVIFAIDAPHRGPVETATIDATCAGNIQDISAKRDQTAFSKVLIGRPAYMPKPASLEGLDSTFDDVEEQTPPMASWAGHAVRQAPRKCSVAILFLCSKNARSQIPEACFPIPDIVGGIKSLTRDFSICLSDGVAHACSCD